MAQLSTQPIVKCSRDGCGNYVKVARLVSTDDASGEKLQRMLRAAAETALCPFHRRQRDYYAQMGRIDDWEAGRP